MAFSNRLGVARHHPQARNAPPLHLRQRLHQVQRRATSHIRLGVEESGHVDIEIGEVQYASRRSLAEVFSEQTLESVTSEVTGRGHDNTGVTTSLQPRANGSSDAAV